MSRIWAYQWGMIPGQPAGLAPQVNSDWAASSGVAAILNKPTIPAAQVQSDWAAASGVSAILNKPAIPAAQVQTDWNAVSGLGQLLNKPTIPAAQVNSDWNAVSGVAQILNKPTLPAAPSQSQPSRALNNAFQISATRNAWVSYSVQITVTASIGGGQNGDIILEIASDSGFTTNVQTIAIAGNGQTYTLAIAIQGVQPTTNVVAGFVPAGYYTRIRSVNNTGTPSYSIRAQQETLL